MTATSPLPPRTVRQSPKPAGVIPAFVGRPMEPETTDNPDLLVKGRTGIDIKPMARHAKAG